MRVSRVGAKPRSPHRRARARRHQPRPDRGGRRRAPARGHLLPAGSGADPAAAAARARGRHRACSPISSSTELNRRHGTNKRFSAAIRAGALAHYDWPGNVRQLRNAVERAFVLCDEVLDVDHDFGAAPARAQRTHGSGTRPYDPLSITLPIGSSLVDIERTFIVATLEHFGGDKRRAGERARLQREDALQQASPLSPPAGARRRSELRRAHAQPAQISAAWARKPCSATAARRRFAWFAGLARSGMELARHTRKGRAGRNPRLINLSME